MFDGEVQSRSIVLFGPTGAGKSTLFNSIFSRKLSGVSPKVNTTNRPLKIAKEAGDLKYIFTDLPGFQATGKEDTLKRQQESSIVETCSAADVCTLILDANKIVKELSGSSVSNYLNAAFERVVQLGLRVDLVVLNKVDRVNKAKLLEGITACLVALKNNDLASVDIVPVSAIDGDGIKIITKLFEELAPKGVKLYAESAEDCHSIEDVAEELIREKLFYFLQEELPYSCAVSVCKWEDEKRLVKIQAFIYVDKDSQKNIVIGQGGTMIKKIGSMARSDIEKLVDKKVFLDLKVKVEKNWRESDRGLRKVGYFGSDL